MRLDPLEEDLFEEEEEEHRLDSEEVVEVASQLLHIVERIIEIRVSKSELLL
jgi:hypothetical protein